MKPIRCAALALVAAAMWGLGPGEADARHRGHHGGHHGHHGSHYVIGIHYGGYYGGGPDYYPAGSYDPYYGSAYRPPASRREYRWARVIEVRPIHVRESEPAYREQCRTELVEERYGGGYYRRPHSAHSGPILGAIIGGLVGNQIGSGGGRAAATVAGAALGHAVAVDRQHARNYVPPATRVVEREVCRRVADGYRESGYIDGYDVTYEFGGEVFHTRTREDPGERIRVLVEVREAY